jgi:hypothetical protein
MKMKIKARLLSDFGNIALLTLLAAPLCAAEMTRLDTRAAGSRVRIEGTSTLHDWQVEGNLIGGYMEVGPDFPLESGQAAKPGKVEAKVDVFIVVNNLRSVEKDGSHYSDKMDEVMHDKLNAKSNPRILYHLEELVLKEAPKSANAPYVFDSKGSLAVAGVTNQIAMPVNITPLGGKKLKVEGKLPTKMSNFKIEPEKIGLGFASFKTGDAITLSFTWMVAQKAPPAAAK